MMIPFRTNLKLLWVLVALCFGIGAFAARTAFVGLTTGEVAAFSRRSSGYDKKAENPGRYWFSLAAWSAVSIGYLSIGVFTARTVRRLQKSSNA